MVLISKANKRKVYENLFNEGVMTVKHDPNQAKHGEVDVPNLHAMMLLRSLCSRNYVTEIYSWQWHYYFLTNEGIEFLRAELHLPAQVFPQTLTKQRPTRPGGEREDRPGWGKGEGK